MTRHGNLFVSKVVTLLFASISLSGCAGNEEKVSSRIPNALAMERACAQRLERIGQFAALGNVSSHASESLHLIEFLNGGSVPAALECEAALSESVETYGAEAYLSLIIDLGYRLARVHGDAATKILEEYRFAVVPALEEVRPSTELLVWIRQRDHLTYKAVPSPVGRAIAKLGLGSYGRKTYAAGGTPGDVLNAVIFMKECNDLLNRSGDPSFATSRQCKAFLGEAEAELRANEDTPSEISGLLDNVGRVPASLADCIADLKGRAITETVSRSESIFACLAMPGTPTDPLISYSSISSANGGPPPHQTRKFRELLSAYDYQEDQTTVWPAMHSPDGSETTTQTNYHYEYKGDPDQTLVVEDTMTVNNVTGEVNAGTHIITTYGDGTVREARYDESGKPVSTFINHPDGSTTFLGYENGKLSITVRVDADGRQFVQDYDEGIPIAPEYEVNEEACGYEGVPECPDNKVIPHDSDKSMPAPWFDDCKIVKLDPKSGDYVKEPYGPLIYPNPIDDPTDIPACVASFSNDEDKSSCPPSAYLCMPPGYIDDETCRCVNSPDSGLPPPGLGRCAQIQCPDQTLCDPMTGACRGSIDGFPIFLPGGPVPFEHDSL